MYSKIMCSLLSNLDSTGSDKARRAPDIAIKIYHVEYFEIFWTRNSAREDSHEMELALQSRN